jgi:hypothetical protein
MIPFDGYSALPVYIRLFLVMPVHSIGYSLLFIPLFSIPLFYDATLMEVFDYLQCQITFTCLLLLLFIVIGLPFFLDGLS